MHPKASPLIPTDVGAPMPGSVIEVRVNVGDDVVKGQPIVVISAMKMEMVVKVTNLCKKYIFLKKKNVMKMEMVVKVMKKYKKSIFFL